MVHHQVLRYRADGVEMFSDLFVPDGATGCGGVLVFPGGAGLSEHARTTARDFAGLGYAALACDLHGGGERLKFTGMNDSRPVLERLMSDPDGLMARSIEPMHALAQRTDVDPSRIGAVGYCMGGLMALDMARAGAQLAAVVGVHSPVLRGKDSLRGMDVAMTTGSTTHTEGRAETHDRCRITGKVMIINGADDPTVPRGDYAMFEDEMRAGGVDYQLHLLGGVVHSFAFPDAAELGNPDVLRYDERAAARAWKLTCNLFEETFAPGMS
jgi:dienelactone hydrolase